MHSTYENSCNFYLIINGLICGRFQISIIFIVASEGGIPQDDFDEH